MRNLTIKRIKSFVASVMKMKVYIEDNVASEIVINGTPCRQLGTLKNGEEKTFEIGDNAAKVFVIADTLSKNYCNDFYQLNEGSEDISLSGKNKFNPATGNAFRFNDNTNEATLSSRKKNVKKGIIILCVAILVGAIAGCAVSGMLSGDNESSDPKTFSSSEGISMTLTEDFEELDMEGFTVCYGTEDVAVLCLKESFSLMDGLEDYTIKQYSQLVKNANGDDKLKELISNDGLSYFNYDFTNPETNDTYSYYVFLYKSEDAFWLVQFSTLTKNKDIYKDQIFEWAKSVSFE